MGRIEWSVSQSHLFNQCPKAWSLRRRKADETGSRVKSVPLGSIVGIAVHRAIAGQITLWRDGMEVSPRSAEETGMDFVGEIWSHRERAITEFVNGMKVGNQTYSRMVDAVHDRVVTFFRMFWPHLSKHTYVTHEALDSFEIPGVRMWVQVDLATRDAAKELLVSDWKTGQGHGIEVDSFQMGVYALWAHVKYERSPSRIHTQVVNLRTGQVNRRTETAESLQGIQARLVEETSRISALDRTDDFVASPSIEVCRSCSYLRVCDEGTSTMDGTGVQSADSEL